MMNSEGYLALVDCARRRLVEWRLSPRELRVMELVIELSFLQEQMWCAIPKLQIMADAMMMDKSGASRAVRSLVLKGALVEQRYKGEILFHFATHATVTVRRSAGSRVTDAQATAARARLIAINRVRQNGRADAMIDPTGHYQPRLDPRMGAEMHEDAGMEVAALQAMMEEPSSEETPIHESPGRRNDAPAKTGVLHSERVTSCRRGLPDQLSFVWDVLIAEIRRGNTRSQEEFAKYAPFWRKQLVLHPYAISEAAADHKLRVKGSADCPGAWIYSRYKRAIADQLALDACG